MSINNQTYRRFEISAMLSPISRKRAMAIVHVTTTDPGRIADLGTECFLRIEKWLQVSDPAMLQLLVDEARVAIDHYADNVDDS
ncbi:hypothetical protein LJR034_001439 [Caballeronia sp. LjRoot34]|uniref:hypothetical protein n=1 Tax=Caballeronia sp. LjRoot34 TaxID=3342325 RepID=UPI003ED11A8A